MSKPVAGGVRARTLAPGAEIGAAVRARRQSLGLTLDELARASAVSRAMLSDVERGRKSPTIRVSAQIAEGLGCTLSDLLAPAPGAPEFELVRQDDRKPFTDPRTGIERHLLSAGLRLHGMEVVLYSLPKTAVSGPFPPHRAGVIEHVTVVRGKLRLQVGSREVELSTGDSITYRAGYPHSVHNLGPGRSDFFLIVASVPEIGRGARQARTAAGRPPEGR